MPIPKPTDRALVHVTTRRQRSGKREQFIICEFPSIMAWLKSLASVVHRCLPRSKARRHGTSARICFLHFSHPSSQRRFGGMTSGLAGDTREFAESCSAKKKNTQTHACSLQNRRDAKSQDAVGPSYLLASPCSERAAMHKGWEAQELMQAKARLSMQTTGQRGGALHGEKKHAPTAGNNWLMMKCRYHPQRCDMYVIPSFCTKY
ncbi:hypothetical protein B0T10DRAFT_482353 [Thelonectria olida]|uniref:Uncharacterized protein n=1 Tax=Thelonectria olida TaxID=1576542 RepID=A0A9P8W937_9HYPO|nr:hypothetical protein B0T10DRAFT_482353 [Thelonectria olida]